MLSSLPLPQSLPVSRRSAAAANAGLGLLPPASCTARLAATAAQPDPSSVQRSVLAWLDGFVIALSLCPFAAAVRTNTRVVACEAGTASAVLEVLQREALALDAVARDEPATTLLALSSPAYADWDNFMALAAESATLVRALTANSQVVPFHPRAVYKGEGDAGNFSTRCPYPVLHLLRQSDVEAAEEVMYSGPPEGWPNIQEENEARLRGIGVGRLSRMLSDLREVC